MTMPDTPALAALREADTSPALCTAFDVAISAAIWGDDAGRPSDLPDSVTAIHDFYDALSAHEDAVAARVRAEEAERRAAPREPGGDLIRRADVLAAIREASVHYEAGHESWLVSPHRLSETIQVLSASRAEEAPR